MKKFNYNVDLTGLNVVMTNDEQHEKFFIHGHPNFLIPDFCETPEDICLVYLDYLEKKWSCEIYDQDGGEITTHQIIDANTGLTKCTYQAYGICMNEGDDPIDFIVEVEGYVVESNDPQQGAYFLATKVFEDSRI